MPNNEGSPQGQTPSLTYQYFFFPLASRLPLLEEYLKRISRRPFWNCSIKQAPFPTAQHRDNVSEQPTTSPLTDLSSTAYAKVICFVIASALCHALAGRTQLAICNTKPWWLGQVAGLVIRAHGAEIVNKSEIVKDRRFLLHMTAFGLGWALDHAVSTIYDDA